MFKNKAHSDIIDAMIELVHPDAYTNTVQRVTDLPHREFSNSILDRLAQHYRALKYLGKDRGKALEEALRGSTVETLREMHDLSQSYLGHGVFYTVNPVIYGSFLVDSYAPREKNSSLKLKDIHTGQVFTCDSYHQWSHHFTPLGVPYKVKGYSLAAMALGAIDLSRFISTHKTTYEKLKHSTDTPIIFLSKTNKRMATFAHDMIGAHISHVSISDNRKVMQDALLSQEHPISTFARIGYFSRYSWMHASEMFDESLSQRLEKVIRILAKYSGNTVYELEKEVRVQAIMYLIAPEQPAKHPFGSV